MDLSAWLDGNLPQSELVDNDIEAFMNALSTHNPLPLTPYSTTNISHSLPTTDLPKTPSSLQGALLEYPLRYRPYGIPPLPIRGPIYNLPVEILIRIFQLVAPPSTRKGVYDLSMLTHVCRFWRLALLNQPRLWSAVFITRSDRRSFVKACLDRSHPATFHVTVEARHMGKIHPDCTCDKGARAMLLPNQSNPCEWHFQFELLAESKHSYRIHSLDIEFDADWAPVTEKARLALGSCRFFASIFPRLVTLSWKNEGLTHADYLFSTPPFVPTLRSLTYVGGWNNLITRVVNLTSFEFEFDMESRPLEINTEAFRLLMCNNRSLESLTLKWVELEGESKGSPAHLLKLKSLTTHDPPKNLSTTICIPAFQRLTSLRISSRHADMYTLHATGDDISVTTECSLNNFAETWENLTGYAKPIIRHVRLYDGPGHVDHYYYTDNSAIALLMMDAHTVEVGSNYLLGWYRSFWEDLKQLGAQLKTIRFEVSEDMDPCPEYDCMHDDSECFVWDTIEDLVKYRFEQGRPFSAVERLVVSESDRENRLQAYVWRCFYGTRKLDQYLRPGQL